MTERGAPARASPPADTVGFVRGVVAVVAAIAAGLLVGCAAAEPTPAETATPQPTTTVASTTASGSPTSPETVQPTSSDVTAPAPGTSITVAGSEFGDVLFDASGQAIYLFDIEATATPECYDQCAVAWPPVLTEAPPVASDGAGAKLLGTTARTDGTTQVTYGGHPLYTYAHEGKNEVRCHNFTGFGGVWFAVAPTGEPAPF